MVRIGRQIPHFEHVDLSSVEAAFSRDRLYRYSLSMRFSDTLVDTGRDRTAAVIMKNPSAADAFRADATIRKVETFVYHRFPDVRWLHILNIFAFRATEPDDLHQAYAEGGAMQVIGADNDHVIGKVAGASDYVILAWGNNSGIDTVLYEERVLRVKHILDKVPAGRIYCITGKKKTKHPLHGLMWGYEYEICPAIEYMQLQ